MKWENTTNENVLNQARDEIWKSWRATCSENRGHPFSGELFNPDKLPAFHDPFAGGGSLPLEAQRLGLESHASDLNPVSVLINKAMIEIPPKFGGQPPVNPEARSEKSLFKKKWRGAQGLAADVLYYGKLLRDAAEERIGNLYPKYYITTELVQERPDLKNYEGKQLDVIAWLWARTVKSPNPAFASVDVPLVSTFILSRMKGNEAYIEPIIEKAGYRFTIKTGTPVDRIRGKAGTKLSRGANFKCIMSGSPIPGNYIKAEGQAGRIGQRMMAIVAEGIKGRIYLPPTPEMENIVTKIESEWRPDLTISGSTQYLGVKPYGMNQFSHLFTERQIVALSTLSELTQEVRKKILADGLSAGLSHYNDGIDKKGTGAYAYSESIIVYLSLVISSLADRMSTLCIWDTGGPTWGTKLNHVFGRQALSMSWDFAEANPFSNQSGSFNNSLSYTVKGIVMTGTVHGIATQCDASVQIASKAKLISTDPPYYDNVPYADLSDFFYVWLRRSLRLVFPDLFATLAVPKSSELVAFAYRHKDKNSADTFFLNGMTKAMRQIADQSHPAFPVTVYYAFKQTENDGKEGTTSTGWEAFLQALIRAGFSITGTWPMRTELSNRMRSTKSNALASSIILVCRPRDVKAPTITRREFIVKLKTELPIAQTYLQRGNIAPVDLAQAAIGPGMAVYTRYSKVLDAEGNQISVREALSLINQTLDEALAEQEGDFDSESRWALAWFDQLGFTEGEYDIAETLSKAKNTSVAGMVTAGILESGRGKVRLLKPDELSEDWDPNKDSRLTEWEIVHQLIRALEANGEEAAAVLVAKLSNKAETARELCYRLYTLCERKKRTSEALSYNALVQSWPEIERLARETAKPRVHEQPSLPGQE